MMACQDGRKKPGDTYEQELVYCIGTRLKQNAVCFPCSDDGPGARIAIIGPYWGDQSN
jgi:hypothetical protein